MSEDLQKNVILSEAKNPAKVRSTLKKRSADVQAYMLGVKRATDFRSLQVKRTLDYLTSATGLKRYRAFLDSSLHSASLRSVQNDKLILSF